MSKTEIIKPRVLFFDVETTPILAYIWGPGSKINVSHEQIKKGERTEIITICYKFLGDKSSTSLIWNMEQQSSEEIIKAFEAILSKADVVIGHNADSFDIKHINTQRAMHKQPMLDWPTSEDTLKQVRKHFKFASNRLDYLAKLLLGEGKSPMGWEDWIQIKENRSQKHLNKMVRYCKRDVRLLEGVWKRLSPHFTPKVNRSILLHDHKAGCPSCGSLDVGSGGFRVTKSGKYRKMFCKTCFYRFKGTALPLESLPAESSRDNSQGLV